jgi:acyl-CoA-binding protein
VAEPDTFAAAQERVKQLARRPSDAQLLELYALYKQATAGDVQGPRPGMLDFKGRAKHDAWAGRRGMPAAEARKAYVALVDSLVRALAAAR